MQMCRASIPGYPIAKHNDHFLPDIRTYTVGSIHFGSNLQRSETLLFLVFVYIFDTFGLLKRKEIEKGADGEVVGEGWGTSKKRV